MENVVSEHIISHALHIANRRSLAVDPGIVFDLQVRNRTSDGKVSGGCTVHAVDQARRIRRGTAPDHIVPENETPERIVFPVLEEVTEPRVGADTNIAVDERNVLETDSRTFRPGIGGKRKPLQSGQVQPAILERHRIHRAAALVVREEENLPLAAVRSQFEMQVAEHEIPAPGRIEINPGHRSDKSELSPLRRVIPDNDQVPPLAGAAAIRGRHAVGHEVNAIRLDGFRLLGQQHGFPEKGFADRQPADRQHFAGIIRLVITRIDGFCRADSTGRQFGPGGLLMVRQHIEGIFGPCLQSLKAQGGFLGRSSLFGDLLQRESALRGLAEHVFIGGRIRQRHGVADLGSRDLAFLVDRSPGIVSAGSPFERNLHFGDRRIVVERAIRQYGHVRARVGDRAPRPAVLRRCGYGDFRGGETHGPPFGSGDHRRADAFFHNRIDLCLAGFE